MTADGRPTYNGRLPNGTEYGQEWIDEQNDPNTPRNVDPDRKPAPRSVGTTTYVQDHLLGRQY